MQFDADIEALIGPAGPGSDMAMGGAYEGASRFDRSLALWAPPIQSADMDILPEKDISDARVRDMLRNDAYVQSGQALHRDGIVGSFFMLNSKPELVTLQAQNKAMDEVWEEEFQSEVEAKFSLWAESPNNWVDASRTNTLTGMVRLAVGVYVAAGEVLATAEWVRQIGRPFMTAIQMIDLDRLSNPYDRVDNVRDLRGGIEFDAYGAPIAYHIRTGHPTDPHDFTKYEWKRVARTKPWGRLQVVHIFEQQRPDQSRGISELVAALKEMKITKKFRDIVLQNAVVNASFAASIESELPPEAAFASIGGGNVGEAVTDYATTYLTAIAEYAGSSKNTHIDGVKIPHLFPGTKLQLRNAGTAGGVGTDFEKSLLRYIAANLGVSYEQLSRDYSGSNYSSMKAATVETGRFMASRKKMVADRFASSVYRLWLEEAINIGEITSLPRNAPSWYERLNADAYARCDWIGAGRGQIDELKETQAAVLRLKYHLSTYEEEHAKLGKDWRAVFAQAEREQVVMKERELVVEEANAINAASGAPREAGGGGDNPEKDAGQTVVQNNIDLTGMAEVLGEITAKGAENTSALIKAVEAVATRVDEAPTINLALNPHIDIDVKTKPGKTTTHVRAFDDKGRILQTETIPENEDEEE